MVLKIDVSITGVIGRKYVSNHVASSGGNVLTAQLNKIKIKKAPICIEKGSLCLQKKVTRSDSVK